MQETNRRTFLLASSSAAATAALAGCGQFYREGREPDNLYAEGDGGEQSGSEDGMSDGESSDGESGDGGSSEDGSSVEVDDDVPDEVANFLSDANLWEGSIEDMTGEDSVSVTNGANSPDYAFDPPAIRVSTGTEVTWEWAEDVSHSVTHDNGDAFDSGIQGGADNTFSHTFDEAGTFLYICIPHQAVGQLGAVVVE